MSANRQLPVLHVEYRFYVPDPDRRAPAGKIQRHIVIDIRPSLLSGWEVTLLDGAGRSEHVGDEMIPNAIRNYIDEQTGVMLGWLTVVDREAAHGK